MTDLASKEQQFLDLLKQHDSLGNAKAWDLLGWDEALYEQVKGSSVAAGQVVLGRGRGGSIRLAEPSGQQASRPMSQQASKPKASKPTGPKAKGSAAQGLQATGPQAQSQQAPEPASQEAQGTQAKKPKAAKATTEEPIEKQLWKTADKLRKNNEAWLFEFPCP